MRGQSLTEALKMRTLVMFTVLSLSQATQIDRTTADRRVRQTDVNANPMPDWYTELINRKNKTQLPPQVLLNDECPKDVIHDRYRGQGYFFSWRDERSANLRMNWNQAVYFCRARCMELVSIETPKEHEYLARHIINGRIRSVWTSGRKCDFAGCESQTEMQPIDIYGWFWEGSKYQLPPTTDRFDSLWSNTGQLGKQQPDNHDGQKGGEHESCLAVLNNAYGDGISWHDVACSKRKPFICEESLKPLPYFQDYQAPNQPATNHVFQYHLINV